MNTLVTYIANSKEANTNLNKSIRIRKILRGLLLSFKTTGALSTLRFYLYTRMYPLIEVKGVCIARNGELRYYKKMKGSFVARLEYTETELMNLHEITSKEYSLLGKERKLEKNNKSLGVELGIKISNIFKNKRDKNTDISLLGSGRFTAGVIVPLLIKNNAYIRFIRKTQGSSAIALQKAYNLDANIDITNKYVKRNSIALVLTSPNYHAQDIIKAVSEGYKIIYAEKPIGINHKDIEMLDNIKNDRDIRIIAGFNRRFAPIINQLMKECKTQTEICHTLYDVRLSDFSESMGTFSKGGGTTVAACCHYIDLLCFLHGRIGSLDVQEIHRGAVDYIDGYSFTVNFKHESGAKSTLRFIRGYPSSAKKRSSEIISISKPNEIYKIEDFESLTFLKKKKIISTKDVKGWNEMYKSLLYNVYDKRFATINDAIENLKICLEIDEKIQSS